jgi:Mg2+ and Co2+ transporter CorA
VYNLLIDDPEGLKMKVNWYLLKSGKLQKQETDFVWPIGDFKQLGETWLDVEESQPDELRQLLAPLQLHPLQLMHCLDKDTDPGVLAFNDSMMMEYPAAFDRESPEPAYLTIILRDSMLVTVRHGLMPTMDDLIQSLTIEIEPSIQHIPQIIYQILDEFADLNVDAQIEIRDQIQRMAKTLSENPNAVDAKDLSQLRWQVGNLISLLENQLYCVSRLSAADIKALQEPHRKAYIQDLVSEAEIAQRGTYRLETRINDLYRDYQMLGSDRVEKRLRLLTIVSAITLPLGLVAGLLGMNVGGVPGINMPTGFFVVVALMAGIALIQYWYFKKMGWFD